MAEESNFGVSRQSNNNAQEEELDLEQEQEHDSLPSWSVAGEDDLYAFDFDPLSPPNVSFFISSVAHSHNFGSNFDSHSERGGDEDEDQMNFITDLFASREEGFLPDPFVDAANQDSNFRVSGGGDGFGSRNREDLGFGFGSPVEFDSVAFDSESGEYSAAPRGANSNAEGGLRVVRIESESDSEEVVEDINSGIHEDETDLLGDLEIPPVWDCVGFEEHRPSNEELEWEEVDERVEEREGLSSVIDRIEELSVSSGISTNEETSNIGEEAMRPLEWEVLLAVNDLERSLEFEEDGESNGVSYLAVPDDYIYEAEYNTLFGQFVQNESAFKGTPPAAKSVIENLPYVFLTKEELQEGDIVCAVCKDEILVEEKVTRLPCFHHYHRGCIAPWLSIRNTCPVCRYEFPTDDREYEERKIRRGSLGLSQDLQVRYNFELLP